MNINQINWHILLVALMEKMVIGQNKLGAECGTTQQSISNWFKGKSVPSIGMAKKLFALCSENDIQPCEYMHNSAELHKIEKKEEFRKHPIKIKRMIIKLNSLHPRRRRKILDQLCEMVDYLENK